LANRNLQITCLADVWAAFVSRRTTLIPTNFWLEDMSIASVAAKGDVDDYCNLANLIFAEIVNLLAEHGPQEGGHVTTHTASISLLWEKMQEWRSLRPSEVKPLLRNSTTQRSVFPKLLYSRSSSSKPPLQPRSYRLTLTISLRQYLLSCWLYLTPTDGVSRVCSGRPIQ
jgi:hypothetical protein